MKDVHAMAPTGSRVTLHQVGVSGIKKPLSVQRAERVVTLTATFSVSVDLPASRKGSDLSRNAELLAEIVDATATRPVESLESACEYVGRELLVRHPYATRAEVETTAEYFRVRGISEGRQSYEDYRLIAEAHASRTAAGGPIGVVRTIGGEAVGMTACPCAMETCRESLVRQYPLLDDPKLADLPMITHNQRNRTRLMFDLSPDVEVEADAILDAIEAAQSSPTYAILKRGDEAQVVLNAHRNPKFVEDVLRDLLASLTSRFPQVPDAARVRAETVSEESIHKYNVTAAHSTTMRELRANSRP